MTTETILAAEKAVASTLRKNEKALATLTAKNARQWQIDFVAAAVAHHRTMLALLRGEAVEQEALEAALAAIPGYIQKIENILPKFAPGTPQHTLAVRRIDAYNTVKALGSVGEGH